MGFSDKDRILIENLYYFKGFGAKNSLRNFRMKVGDCGNWTNLWKSCEKLARRQ